MIRRPPRSTLFPTRRSSDLAAPTRIPALQCDERHHEKEDQHTQRGCWSEQRWLLLEDRKSTRLNSSHSQISYAVFCLKKKTKVKHKNDVIENFDLDDLLFDS